MNKFCYAVLLLLFFLLISLSLAAEQRWPLSDVVMHSSFSPLYAGVHLSGDTEAVHALSEGELLYANVREDFSSLPTPLGNYALIEHEGGFFSLYANIHQIQDVELISERLAKDSLIAEIDESAASRKTLYFAIFDREQKQWVNPQLLLSSVYREATLSLEYAKRNEHDLELVFAANSPYIIAPYKLIIYEANALLFDVRFNTSAYASDALSIIQTGIQTTPFTIRIPYSNDTNELKIQAWTFEGMHISHILEP